MSKKYNVILDLDNTLISAEPLEEFPFNDSNVKKKAINFTIHDMDGYYIVFERPGVQEFLDHIFEHYNVSVWTAASKDYAVFIIDNIVLPKHKRDKRHLDYILFAYHCDFSRKHLNTSKHLNMLYDVFKLEDYKPSNTIIIDDHPDVYGTQPSNCIHIKAFHFLDNGSENDRETHKTIDTIKHKFLELQTTK